MTVLVETAISSCSPVINASGGVFPARTNSRTRTPGELSDLLGDVNLDVRRCLYPVMIKHPRWKIESFGHGCVGLEDLVDIYVSPSAGMVVDYLQVGFLALQILHIPVFPDDDFAVQCIFG